jgi:hypothetical protein
MHAFNRRQGPGDQAFGVVVALDNEDADSFPRKTHHLFPEEQTSAEVTPVAVVDVSGEQDKIDTLIDRQFNQRDEGLTRRAAKALNGRPDV